MTKILYAASNLPPKQYSSQKHNRMPCLNDAGLPAAKHRTVHKYTGLHDVIFWLTSNTTLIPALLEISFFKESSKGSPHSKEGGKKPHQKNMQNHNKATSKET